MGSAAPPGQPSSLFQLAQRAAYDDCALAEIDRVNRDASGYTFAALPPGGPDKPQDFALQHPNLRFLDGYVAPAMVDEDTELRLRFGWHPRGRQQLFPRTYQAGPDMSRGELRDETTLYPEMAAPGQGGGGGPEVDRFEPLIPERRKDVQDPEHIIPSAWQRGGEDTRSATRTLAYVTSEGLRRESAAGPGGHQLWGQ
jgi:hypothetical protein